MKRFSTWSVCYVVWLAYVSAASAVTFPDSTFDMQDWTPVIHLYDDASIPGVPAGPPVSAGSIVQWSPGGNPGSYSHSYIALEYGYSISTSGIYIDQSYDPSVQAVASLDYSFHVRHISALAGTQTDAFPALLQDGRLYLGEVTGPTFTGNSWSSKSWSGLKEDDFIAIDVVYTGATIRPDFSAFGAPLQFGYALTNSVNAPGILYLYRGVDNWAVDINLAAMSDIHGDGVDATDLDIWSAGYGTPADALLVDGDFDHDDDVDGFDFLKWQREFGSTAPPFAATVAIPEPATLGLLLTGLLAIPRLKPSRSNGSRS